MNTLIKTMQAGIKVFFQCIFLIWLMLFCALESICLFPFVLTLLFLSARHDSRQGRWSHELLTHFISPTWCFYWLSISSIPPRRAAPKSCTLHASSLSHTLGSLHLCVAVIDLYFIWLLSKSLFCAAMCSLPLDKESEMSVVLKCDVWRKMNI